MEILQSIIHSDKGLEIQGGILESKRLNIFQAISPRQTDVQVEGVAHESRQFHRVRPRKRDKVRMRESCFDSSS
jgi:hypothetical protein